MYGLFVDSHMDKRVKVACRVRIRVIRENTDNGGAKLRENTVGNHLTYCIRVWESGAGLLEISKDQLVHRIHIGACLEPFKQHPNHCIGHPPSVIIS